MKNLNIGPLKAMCYESHPALQVGDFKVYGGSASSPIVLDADIYVSLQEGSRSRCASDPWDAKLVQEIFYPITDGSAPKEFKRFGLMIEWLCTQLQSGKKLHVGCIGGHGRTGMVLAALVAKATGNANAVQYVRDNYCKKAVESHSQMEYLHKHYGVKVVEGSKSYTSEFQTPSGWSPKELAAWEEVDREIENAKRGGRQKSFGFQDAAERFAHAMDGPSVSQEFTPPRTRGSRKESIVETLHPINSVRSIWRRIIK